MDHVPKKMRDEVYLDEGLVAHILVHLPAQTGRGSSACKRRPLTDGASTPICCSTT